MYTVAVSGIGALIGYGIVRSLRLLKPGVRILGIDVIDTPVGRQWCDSFELVDPITSPNYLDSINYIINKHSVDLYCPGIPKEVKVLYDNWDHLANIPTKFVINNRELLKTSFDKWLTHISLKAGGFKTIPSALPCAYSIAVQKLGVPFLMKPRVGESSKGICTINNLEEYNFHLKKWEGSGVMLQKIVGSADAEYTVGAFGLGDGSVSGIINLKRKLSFEGWTKTATVFEDERLNMKIEELAKYFKPIGPTNFQFRQDHEEYLLLEINARFSSSNSIRTAFGFNESEMCVQYYLKGKKLNKPKIKKGSALRYVEDVFCYEK